MNIGEIVRELDVLPDVLPDEEPRPEEEASEVEPPVAGSAPAKP
jgi:hypothetical protein